MKIPIRETKTNEEKVLLKSLCSIRDSAVPITILKPANELL
jgi:hypothetical protein